MTAVSLSELTPQPLEQHVFPYTFSELNGIGHSDGRRKDITRELEKYRSFLKRKYPTLRYGNIEVEKGGILVYRTLLPGAKKAVSKFGVMDFGTQNEAKPLLEECPLANGETKWNVKNRGWAFAGIGDQVVPGILVKIDNNNGFWIAEDQIGNYPEIFCLNEDQSPLPEAR